MLPHFLALLEQFHCPIFIHEYKILPPSCPPSPFPYSLSHSPITHSQKGSILTFLSFSFFKVYIDSPMGFVLAFQTCIYHALIRLLSITFLLYLDETFK
jgi:hypothetical protein